MGNEISDQSSGRLKNLENSKLTQFIQKWALENYDGGLNYGKTTSNSITDVLRKRAVCTRQLSLKIALPEIEADKIVYSSILIDIFKNNPELEAYMNASNGFDSSLTEKGVVLSRSKCVNDLYIPLCGQVREDRDKMYSSLIHKLYGPLPDTNTTNNRKTNAYTDCNCENSFYKHNINLSDVSSNVSGLSYDTLAQNLDKRCSGVLSTAFKTENAKYEQNLNVCINEQKIGGNITADEKSTIGLNQSCNQSISTGSGAPGSTGGTPTTPAPPPQPQLPASQPPKGNEILLYSAVASIVIFNLIFLLRK